MLDFEVLYDAPNHCKDSPGLGPECSKANDDAIRSEDMVVWRMEIWMSLLPFHGKISR
jgi:hypothetical protein